MKTFLPFTLLCCISAGTAHCAEPAQKITVDLGGGEKLEMVLIPAGEFLMGDARGDRDEYPTHKVKITKPFYMAKYELTQDQWGMVMDSPAPGSIQGARNPVDSVDRTHVATFLVKLNEKLGGKPFVGRHPLDLAGTEGTYHLPTEAEWEYACRAGSTTRYSFGDDEKALGQYAWYYDNSEAKSHPVGEKKPNAWGLYDMHGNVWEMCRDEYFADYYMLSPTADPLGQITNHRQSTVVRGGGWNYSAKSCRSADRGYFGTVNNRERGESLGFRVARSVEEN